MCTYVAIVLLRSKLFFRNYGIFCPFIMIMLFHSFPQTTRLWGQACCCCWYIYPHSTTHNSTQRCLLLIYFSKLDSVNHAAAIFLHTPLDWANHACCCHFSPHTNQLGKCFGCFFLFCPPYVVAAAAAAANANAMGWIWKWVVRTT